MLTEALLSAIAEAVFSYLLQETDLAGRVRAVLGVDPEHKAFRIALARAYAAFARQYPDLAASLFDKPFLKSEAATSILAQLLTRRGHPDPAALARLWVKQLGYHDPDTWPRLAEVTRAAADFLRWLEGELAEQRVLWPLWDARALEAIRTDVAAIRRALDETLSKALAEAQKYARAVQVAGSIDRSIIVTGDRNTVTQVFQTFLGGDYTPLADLYLPPDGVFERVRLDDFAGRAWLEAELDRFLSEHEVGVWLLEGEAGVGKTTFLAHLVRERRYLHFFAEQAPGEASVTRAFESLTAQLVSRYHLEPYASRDALPASQTAYPDFLERLLRMAAGRLTAGERLVIVADGLDEAGIGPNRNVLGLPKVLPKGVYLILSQRPVNVPLHVDPYPVRVDLRAGDARNLADMDAYLRSVARRPAIAGQLRARGYAEDYFVQVLKEKSAGNWMYLHHVVQEIEQGQRHPLDLEGLPKGLAGYYVAYWNRWRDKPEWDRLYAPLLATLAAAREAASPEMLARWAGLEADYRFKRLLREEWAPFLFRNDDRFRLYHASLRDFLRGAMAPENLISEHKVLVEEMAERTREAHRRIADHYSRLADGDWQRLADVDGGYGLRHLAAHLAGAGEWERLHRLVADGEERQPWAEARHAVEGNYGGYLADLALAWQRAAEEGERDLAMVGRQVRYALIEASIHSLAGSIPSGLLVALVENEVWTPTAALAYARQMPDESQRAEALKALAPHLPQELLREALAAAREIQHADARAEALNALAERLPEVWPEALAAAREIRQVYARARALSALAKRLPPELLPAALAAAREIQYADDRARALSALAERLPEVWPEALAAAREIEYASNRAKALSTLAEHLPPQLLPAALAAAREIQYADDRARALSALAERLPPELLPAALAAAREIKDAHARASVLSALAKRFPELLPAALAATKEIEYAYARAHALSVLAERLPLELLPEALAAAREIRHADARAEVLSALAKLFPELLPEALAAAREIEDAYARAETLSALGEHLPPELLPAALSAPAMRLPPALLPEALSALVERLPPALLPEALAAAREIKYASARIEALSALAERLPPELLPEALAAAREIEDAYARAKVLSALAERFPELLPEALAAARKIKYASARARALSALAKRLPLELLPEALAAARKIEDASARAETLNALAEHLPPELLPEALAAAREIEDASARAETLNALAEYLPPELLPEALAAAREIEDASARAETLNALAEHLPPELLPAALAAAGEIEYASARAKVLSALAKRLPPELLSEALAAAREIENAYARVCALSALAERLPEVWPEALAAAREIEDAYARADALSALAEHLPEVLPAALAVAREIKDAHARASVLSALAERLPPELLPVALAAAREIKDAHARASVLSALAERLPPELLPVALAAAREIEDASARARALNALAERFPELLPEALAATKEIEYTDARAHALSALAKRLPELLPEALAATKEIEYTDARAHALSALVERLAALPCAQSYPLWTETLPFLARRTRRDLLADLCALAPVIHALGGEEAIVEIFRAIQDVGRWWP